MNADDLRTITTTARDNLSPTISELQEELMAGIISEAKEAAEGGAYQIMFPAHIRFWKKHITATDVVMNMVESETIAELNKLGFASFKNDSLIYVSWVPQDKI